MRTQAQRESTWGHTERTASTRSAERPREEAAEERGPQPALTRPPPDREPERAWCPSLPPAERWDGRPRTLMIPCRHHSLQSSFLSFLPPVPWDQTLPVRQGPYWAGWLSSTGGGRAPQAPRARASLLLILRGRLPGSPAPPLTGLPRSPGILRTTPGLPPLPPPRGSADPPHARKEDRSPGWRRDGAWAVGSQPPAGWSFLPGVSPRGQAGEPKGLGPVTWSRAPRPRTR